MNELSGSSLTVNATRVPGGLVWLLSLVLAAGSPETPKDDFLYSHDFEQAPGQEWSRQELSETPRGKRSFLGAFGPETVSLTLPNLPKHQFVHLTFDLYLIQSWDGNSQWGPDVWELSVRDRQRLIHATFSNLGFFQDNNAQTFPDDFQDPPLPFHPAWTGAEERQSLGYEFFAAQLHGKAKPTDAVYRFDLVFPHRDDTLTLDFRSLCDDGIGDQSWGIDTIRVATRTDPEVLTKAQLGQSWDQLGDEDPAVAFDAIWQLAATGDQAVRFMGQQLFGKREITVDLPELLQQLDHDEFRIREQATLQLIKEGPVLTVALSKALAKTESVEVRTRIKRILVSFAEAARDPARAVHRARARRVLRVIDSRAAQDMHAKILDHYPSERPQGDE